MATTSKSEFISGTTQKVGELPDRRRSIRHRLRNASGTLEWQEDGERIVSEMRMLDISDGGAVVLARRRLPTGQDVRITLNSSAIGIEPLEARVVVTSDDPSGEFVVRMQFKSWFSIGSVLEEHQEQRQWQRYPAIEKRASVMWWDGENVNTTACDLINISGGGAAAFSEETLPDKTALWLTLHVDEESSAPVECRLIVASVDVSGLTIVRFRFVEPCPMDLFELAIHGRGASQ